MSLYLALSSLQGRPMDNAAEELLSLGDVGLQLTPGCAPVPGFRDLLAERTVATRSHHGFSWIALRRNVWHPDGTLLTDDHSVHPPKLTDPAAEHFWDVAEALATTRDVVFESMYPGWLLGTGTELQRAMTMGLPLAIDISHLNIQRHANTLDDTTLRRVYDYDNVAEIHISANNGRSDQHLPIERTTFGLDWALERFNSGVPTVFESYVHKRSDDERRRQIDLILEHAPR